MFKGKKVRFCIECGGQHDTGVENTLTGDFQQIDKCRDCLLSKCSFTLEKTHITLDEVNSFLHFLSRDDFCRKCANELAACVCMEENDER